MMATVIETAIEHGDTLVEQVDRLVRPGERPHVWGNPLLSVTPSSLAIHEIAIRIEALETAVHEIAVEVKSLVDD